MEDNHKTLEKVIDPEEIIRRAEGCSYLTDQDVELIREKYRRKSQIQESYSTFG